MEEYMQSVILAAGLGKRLKELTSDHTKCMVKVNGITLIERALRQLDECSMDRIIIVTGYKAEALEDFVRTLGIRTPIVYVRNNEYEKTNNIYSLWLTKDYLTEDDTLVLESDIIFEKAVLDRMLSSNKKCMTFVAKPEPWMDGSVVSLDKDGNIRNFISTRTFDFSNINDYYKTVSIYKFSREFLEKEYIPFLDAYVKAWGNSQFYESALKVIAIQEKPVISAMVLDKEKWYEINDIQDLDIAQTLFAEGHDKLKMYLRRYGGYWRYPTMYDFCYLVNPFFPNDRFMNEMKANFETLVREYPSGMGVNSLLAGKYFELYPEYVCVGNGTAELIKSLMENLEGKIGMVYPTFEEYPHRKKEEDVIPYYVIDKDFKYTVDDLMEFYVDKDISAIILVNPDNPSGHFITRADILRLADWGKTKNINIIVDESFIDFARTDENQTLLYNDVLTQHTNLIVLKSISKSFGVPGLRLGIIATSNKELIAFMKKDVAIWNINSFAEYYMQIIEKYKDDYIEAMERFKDVRDRYVKKLNTIKGLKVYVSQANYIMAYIENGISSAHLADILLNKYNILIKDLSTKDGLYGRNFVRLSVKTDEENDTLINALNEIFE